MYLLQAFMASDVCCLSLCLKHLLFEGHAYPRLADDFVSQGSPSDFQALLGLFLPTKPAGCVFGVEDQIPGGFKSTVHVPRAGINITFKHVSWWKVCLSVVSSFRLHSVG